MIRWTRPSPTTYRGDLSEPAYQQLVRTMRERRRQITAECERVAACRPPQGLLTWQERVANTRYKLHPLACLFPLLSPIRFAELCVDIREHGMMQPIVLHNDLIIDGRNRLLACAETKIDPHFIDFESLGLNCSVEQYIWSANMERRHLTDDQRAAIAHGWKGEIPAAAKERQRQAGGDKSSKPPEKGALGENTKSAPLHTREALAAAAEVSPNRIRVVEEVQRTRPDLIPKVIAGEITLRAAQKEAEPRATKAPEVFDYGLVVNRAARAISDLIADALGHVHPDARLLFLDDIGKRMAAIVQGHKRPGVGPGAIVEIARAPEAADALAVPGRPIDIAAKAAGVSVATIRRCIQIKASDPEAFERLGRGESTVNAEYQKMRKKKAAKAK